MEETFNLECCKHILMWRQLTSIRCAQQRSQNPTVISRPENSCKRASNACGLFWSALRTFFIKRTHFQILDDKKGLLSYKGWSKVWEKCLPLPKCVKIYSTNTIFV